MSPSLKTTNLIVSMEWRKELASKWEFWNLPENFSREDFEEFISKVEEDAYDKGWADSLEAQGKPITYDLNKLKNSSGNKDAR